MLLKNFSPCDLIAIAVIYVLQIWQCNRKGSPVEAEKSCKTVELHAGHICELESEQDWETLAKVTSAPAVRCENCGAEANSSRNVCMPEDL